MGYGKIIAAFIGGLALGGAAGYFGGEYIYKKKADKELKERYENLTAIDLVPTKKDLPAETKEAEVVEVKDTTETPDKEEKVVIDTSEVTEQKSSLDIPLPFDIDTRTEYDRQFNPYNSAEKDAISEAVRMSAAKPYLISTSAFMDGESGYKQHTLIYYTKDYVIDEVNRDKIDYPIMYNVTTQQVMTYGDMVKFLGTSWMSRFGDEDLEYDDMDTVFVRNDVNAIEFSIEKRNEYYKVEVLGMDEDDPYDYDEAR